MKIQQKNKKRISITIIPVLDERLENLSGRLGVSKSSLIEKAVKKFLCAQLDCDTKALAKMQFDDLPTEDEWLELGSEI